MKFWYALSVLSQTDKYSKFIYAFRFRSEWEEMENKSISGGQWRGGEEMMFLSDWKVNGKNSVITLY